MSSPLAPFSKHDFNPLWKSGPPDLEVYLLIRKLLERKVVQILEDSSRRAPNKLIQVVHIKQAKRLY